MSTAPDDVTTHPADDGLRTWRPVSTLPGAVYHADEIWDRERAQLFAREWIYVARDEEFPEPGDRLVRALAGMPVLLVRGAGGDVGAYHARDRRPAHAVTVAGFVFVSLAPEPEPFDAYCARNPEGDIRETIARWRPEELRIAHTIVYEVAANWKIVTENYNECLHCPTIHPELVKLVPLFRTGVTEGEEGAELAHGATSFTVSGRSDRPPLPGLAPADITSYNGNHVFPTLMINLHSDCVMTYRLEPISPVRTRVVSEFCFHPDTIARPDFDPSDIVGFWDLISKQDWAVCERAQLGVASRAYARGGVHPFNDRWIAAFNERYRDGIELG
ncbi:MAG: SRPBCC family protein [Actinomycetota bacterium]